MYEMIEKKIPCGDFFKLTIILLKNIYHYPQICLSSNLYFTCNNYFLLIVIY